MVNDTILAGLTNLFALFGARDCVDIEVSKQKLHNYLARHFGIRDTETFIMGQDAVSIIYIFTTTEKATIVLRGVVGGIEDNAKGTGKITVNGVDVNELLEKLNS